MNILFLDQFSGLGGGQQCLRDLIPGIVARRWTAHVGVLRWYPWILRWLFSVPKNMTSITMLKWLERRYGGSIVIDFAALNGRGREMGKAISANIRQK